MGKYNTAVLTTVGQALLTSVIGDQGTLTFSKFQTSSYQYASGTDLSALTSLNNVEQTVIPSAGGISDATTFYSSSTVSNSGLAAEYTNYTVGLFASDGNSEVLFAVSTADVPDIIPADAGGTPSTYTYTMSIGVSATDDITVEVDEQGILRVSSVVDNLSSTSATQPLSAKQGKVLKDLIDQGGGGHVILDSDGNEMPQRDDLQFGEGFNVTDDAVNNKTIIKFASAKILIGNSTNDLTGESVTVKLGGATVTTGIVGGAVTVADTGTYTLTCGVYSTTVLVSALGASYNADITTTNSWKLWVTEGGLDPDDYANLAAVLADEEAVRELMNTHASVDFLANDNKNTTLISTIINDNYCAKWINLRDYALDALYANEDIADLMDTADKYFYGEWVITDNTTTPPTWGPKGNVPVMTSNTAPYGEASASSAYSTYYAWKAYDGVVGSSNRWSPNNDIPNSWLQYKFTNPICVKKLKFAVLIDENTLPSGTIQIKGSNDNSNWTDIESKTWTKNAAGEYFDITNDNYYLYYRVVCTSYTFTVSSSSGCAITTLQFYGRELKVSVPTMTSNTAPYGEAIASSVYDSSYANWKAFDDTTSDTWQPATTDTYGNAYVGYKFISPVIVRMVKMFTGAATEIRIKTYKLQGSNDGNTWTDIGSTVDRGSSTGDVLSLDSFNNDTEYLYYRVLLLSGMAFSSGYAKIPILNFYGLDYSEHNERHYIYDHGVELETITEYELNSNCIVEKQADCIYTKIPATNDQMACAYISSDTTNYSLFRAVLGNVLYCSAGSGAGGSLIINSTTPPSGSNVLAEGTIRMADSSLPNNISLDISSIDDTVIIGVCSRSGSSSYMRESTITEWWLE